MCSQIFFCKQKVTRVFQWHEDINVVVIIALSFTKPCLSFLKFNLELRFFGKRTSCLWSQLFPSWNLIKTFNLLSKKSFRKFDKRFWRRKTAEDDNVKIKDSWTYLVPFSSSKVVHFFKFSFGEKTSFKFCTTR